MAAVKKDPVVLRYNLVMLYLTGVPLPLKKGSECDTHLALFQKPVSNVCLAQGHFNLQPGPETKPLTAALATELQLIPKQIP